MIQCTACRYFRPDAINPGAGMGRCMHDARHRYWHPDAKHSCGDYDHQYDGRNGNGYQPLPGNGGASMPPGAE